MGCVHWRTAAGAVVPHWECSFPLRCGVAPGERIGRRADPGVGDGSGARVAVREGANGAHKWRGITCSLGGEALRRVVG